MAARPALLKHLRVIAEELTVLRSRERNPAEKFMRLRGAVQRADNRLSSIPCGMSHTPLILQTRPYAAGPRARVVVRQHWLR